MASLQQETVNVGQTRIAYTIRRSDRRNTIGMMVTADGYLEIAAPASVSNHRIAEAVRGKIEWIIRRLEENRHFQNLVLPKMISGESVRYLGQSMVLKFIPGAYPDIRIKRSAHKLEFRMPAERAGKPRSDDARKALGDWYRKRLEEIVPPIAGRFAQQIGEAFSTIRVRELGQRWGSCGKNKVLYFNWRLAMAPKSLIELVVAHEICHLRYSRHSREFHGLLARILPDWESRQEQLDREGPQYDL